MPPIRRMIVLATACALIGAGCVPTLPTGTTGTKPRPGESKKPSPAVSASPSTGASNPPTLTSPSPTSAGQIPAGFYAAQVLGLDGKPAANVPIKSFVIATGGGNVIATGGGNVISTGGGNVISTGGGNFVSTNGGTYQVLQAAEVKTDAEGKFYMKPLTDGNKLTVEAILSDTVKAIQMEIGSETRDFVMKLAKTGSISGKVSAPEAPSVTNFENVDVFVPGTSYSAKTDAAGNFTISNVPVGDFTVVATKEGLGRANANGVKVESEKTTAVASLPLSIKAPTLTQLTPDIGGPGVEVTITGDHFGASEGKTFQVTFGGVIASTPTRVDDKTIKVKVPSTVSNGDVVVSVGGITSAGSAFKVIKDLLLESNPTQLVKGLSYAFKVTGKDSAGNTLVAPPVTWSAEGTGLTVDAAGTVKGSALGSGKVKAASGDKVVELALEVVDSLYEVSTFAGGPGGALSYPEYLAFGPDDHLYVSDSVKHVIHKISPQGVVTTFAGSTVGFADGQGSAAKFDTPLGLGFDGSGNLFVADRNNHRIRKITADGTVTTIIGNGNPTMTPLTGPLPEDKGTCAGPLAIKVDGSNNLYFTESHDGGGLRRARKLSPDNTMSQIIANEYPGGPPTTGASTWIDMVMNGSTLIVPETEPVAGYSRIFKVSGNTATLLAGGSTTGNAIDGQGAAAGFGTIQGIGLDNDGNFFTSEVTRGTQSHLIRKITPTGVVTTVAGVGNGFADGTGQVAKFQSPTDITLGPDGCLYVADRGNQRIRKLKLIQGE